MGNYVEVSALSPIRSLLTPLERMSGLKLTVNEKFISKKHGCWKDNVGHLALNVSLYFVNSIADFVNKKVTVEICDILDNWWFINPSVSLGIILLLPFKMKQCQTSRILNNSERRLHQKLFIIIVIVLKLNGTVYWEVGTMAVGLSSGSLLYQLFDQ